jgi:hypothetical protein
MRKLTKRDTDAIFQQLEALGWLDCIPLRKGALGRQPAGPRAVCGTG